VEFVEKKVMTEGPVLNLPIRAMIGSIIHGGIMVPFSWRSFGSYLFYL